MLDFLFCELGKFLFFSCEVELPEIGEKFGSKIFFLLLVFFLEEFEAIIQSESEFGLLEFFGFSELSKS